MSRTVQVTFDCADPNALAGFWNEVLGYRYDSPPPGLRRRGRRRSTTSASPRRTATTPPPRSTPTASGRGCCSRRCPRARPPRTGSTSTSGPPPGSRATSGWPRSRRECERLVALGATRVARFEPEPPMSKGFIVMQDPEGNEFCLD